MKFSINKQRRCLICNNIVLVPVQTRCDFMGNTVYFDSDKCLWLYDKKKSSRWHNLQTSGCDK